MKILLFVLGAAIGAAGGAYGGFRYGSGWMLNDCMHQVARDARDYRAANPRKSSRPHVDAMVGNLLSRQK